MSTLMDIPLRSRISEMVNYRVSDTDIALTIQEIAHLQMQAEKWAMVERLQEFTNKKCANCDDIEGHNWAGLFVDDSGHWHVGNGVDEYPCEPFANGDGPAVTLQDAFKALEKLT